LSIDGLAASVGTASVDALSVSDDGALLFGATIPRLDPPGNVGTVFLYDPATDAPALPVQGFEERHVGALVSAGGGTFIGLRDPASFPFGTESEVFFYDHDQNEVTAVGTFEQSGVINALAALTSGPLLVAHGHGGDPHGTWRLDALGQAGHSRNEFEPITGSSWPVRVDAHGDEAVWATTDPEDGFEGGGSSRANRATHQGSWSLLNLTRTPKATRTSESIRSPMAGVSSMPGAPVA
jgi:hypothetical protein